MEDPDLARGLSGLVRSVAAAPPAPRSLDNLVRGIVAVLPVDAAGVTLVLPPDGPRLAAASDELAMRFEQLQLELDQGPCVAAYATGQSIAVPDLALDDRFPSFAEQALAEDLGAVFSFPLRYDDRRLGSLTLYRETAGSLSPSNMTAAQALADAAIVRLVDAHALAALKAAAAREHRALEELRVLDRTRTDFLTNVVHELRTPMIGIAGYTQMLRSDAAGDLSATQQELVEAIGRSSSELTSLANDLLTLARLDQSPSRGEQVEVDLVDVVIAARTATQGLVDMRVLRVTFEVPDLPVFVVGDARHLERMISNLLTNAIKFTDDGGWVRCILTSGAQRAHIEVSDSGIGIAQAELPDLFTRFFRSSNGKGRSIAGSGLGLSIVESIAHTHHGRVSVTSAPDEGSAFRVDLPLLSA